MNFTEVIDNAKAFARPAKKRNTYDDLLVDRLHNRYTVALLICFCIAISTYDFLGNPLQCWVPAQFTDNYEDYTNRLCYIQNTYHVPKHELVPQHASLRRERTLKYYQWMHFVLLLQALLFSVPRIIWQSFNTRIGLPIGNLLDASNKSDNFDTDDDRNAVIRYISDCLQRYEDYINPVPFNKPSPFKRATRQFRLFCHARTGASLAYFYVSIKLLYIFNLIFQLFFLQYFLSYHDVNYFQYGFELFDKLFSGLSMPESRLFPRITLCDFRVRELGEQHLYTVECILVINIFLEKMYFLLWIWFTTLLCITIIDLARLLYRIFIGHSRHVFIRESLELLIDSPTKKNKHMEEFLRSFLIDNLFALRLISSNSNVLIVAEILGELFRRKFQQTSNV